MLRCLRTLPLLVLTLSLVGATGCATKHAPTARLGDLYNRAAQFHGPERNPVVVIPGILGSRLEDPQAPKGQRVVWGAFDLGGSNLKTATGRRALALPMRFDAPLDQLRDTVEATRALDRVSLRVFGLPIELKAYAQILGVLGAGGYRDPAFGNPASGLDGMGVDFGADHFTCFQFAYDWRRDMVENARLLDAFLTEKEAEIAKVYRERYGIADPQIKFDLVGHSMGAVLSRYYLRHGTAEPTDTAVTDGMPRWSGAQRVGKAILIAPPNAGSVKAYTELLQGMDSRPILYAPPAVVGTFPATYQLMPRDRHGMVKLAEGESLYDPEVWEERQWGLFNPNQEEVLRQLLPGTGSDAKRRAIARDHVRKSLERAAAIHRAIDTPASPPFGTQIHLIAGDAISTPSEVTPGQRGAFEVTNYAPGDDTVIRSSALLDERLGQADGQPWSPTLRTPIDFDSVHFLFKSHLGLTQDPAFHDNLLYLLLEAPRALRAGSE